MIRSSEDSPLRAKTDQSFALPLLADCAWYQDWKRQRGRYRELLRNRGAVAALASLPRVNARTRQKAVVRDAAELSGVTPRRVAAALHQLRRLSILRIETDYRAGPVVIWWEPPEAYEQWLAEAYEREFCN